MSPAPTVRTSGGVTRRAALGGLAGATLVGAGLAGCGTAEPPRLTATRADQQPSSGRGSEDPDTRLLHSVVHDVAEVVALLEAVRRRHGSLRPRVDRLLSVHAAHRELLASADADNAPAPTPTARAPRRRSAATAEVTRREDRLATRLSEAALEAESGTFARALASMSAGVRQHLAAA